MKKIVNKKAGFNYQILEKFETGIVLTGSEVKSIKEGRLKLEEAFVRIKDSEAWLLNAYIPPYSFSSDNRKDPRRERKLLLKKKELLKLKQQTEQKGLTLIPISCYNRHNKIKLEIALAKGKKKYEKRETIRKKDWKLEIRN